jgi:protein-S-isoprenylcysteine O-methyltransferase Ste14
MRASAFEFRFRMWIQVGLVVLGFWAPWIGLWSSIGFWSSPLGTLDLGRRISTLAWLAVQISRLGIATFTVVTPIVIVAGALFAAAGMVLRVWGSAYLGYGTVHDAQMQGGAVMAAGPYRYLRNPLYLGGWFMMLAMSLLMPPSGALFVMMLVTIFYLRLILGEEAFLSAKLGEPYRLYLRAVPRILPRLRSSLPAAPANPHWLVAVATELNPIGIFFTFAVLSWTYDNLLMIKAVVICFGISLIVRACIPGNAPRPDAA